VKLANILLSARLEAKVADFGLSKAFNNHDTHVATATIAGTPGYLDPEYVNPNALQQILLFYHFAPLFLLDNSFMNPTCRYHITGKPTSKSDVYSFGVVLLQLVAGRPANLRDPENTSVVQWARQRLAQGNIEAVVDLRMRGDHDINSVWKVADVALKCTAQASAERPTMTDVVAQLQECLELEQGATVKNGLRTCCTMRLCSLQTTQLFIPRLSFQHLCNATVFLLFALICYAQAQHPTGFEWDAVGSLTPQETKPTLQCLILVQKIDGYRE
jgi:serine/threonine protein kinase